ncbi:uncharacterized protein LOC135842423 [Planococcus citri]|uniref:uncharacterized protein LOC135842423 n=1 Tax=Planococcus citri TaxID=170843 RepID=UPI0031F9F575
METWSSTLIAIEHKNGGICLTENRRNDADYTRLAAKESCHHPWFQDITPIFELFLSGRKDMAFVFPPGSGKSTVAEMFEKYAHYESDVAGYDSFFSNCTFKKQNEELYLKFYRQCAVVRIDFRHVNIGDTLLSYREAITNLIRWIWRKYAFDEFHRTEEEKLRKDKFRYKLSLKFLFRTIDNDNKFLLLDSVDCIYNQIAKIAPKVKENLFKDFTDMIYSPQDKDTGLTHISFGVSPYFITEHLRKGTCTFSIFPRSGSIDQYDTEEIERWNLDNNLALQTFSYGEDSIRTTCERINKMCEESESMKRIENVDDMIETCKKIGSYRVNDIELLNPYLVISYLWSFTKKRNYRLDIAPKSLWFESIHTKADCEMLRELLHTQETKKIFDMFPSFKIINTDRKHFLPLLCLRGIFVGYVYI